MEQAEDTTNINSSDLQNLTMTISRITSEFNSEDVNIIEKLVPIIRGLGSHKPQKRSGYSIVLSYVLETYRDRVSEDELFEFIKVYHFVKKSKKSSIRTATVAKLLALTCFVRSRVFTNDEHILYAINELIEVGKTRQTLLSFVCTCLASVIECSSYKNLDKIVEGLPVSLDSFIFWIKALPNMPSELRGTIPAYFKNGFFNDGTAEAIQHCLHHCKQPWNSPIWKLILQNGSDSDLLTFWPLIVCKEARGGDEKTKFSIILIVKNVLATLRESVFSIVICASFIKMINQLLAQPMLSANVSDFLSYVVSLSSNEKLLLPILDSFAYVDSHLPDGFKFHKQLYSNCSSTHLRKLFEDSKIISENSTIEFKQRIPSTRSNEDSMKNFILDRIRAIFIASAKHNDAQLSIEVFDYISNNWTKQRSLFVSDLVSFDDNRVEGAASLSDLLKEPQLNHFESCYRLYSYCTGASSSPSLDTLIPPDVTSAPPSTDFILVSAQRANEPALIKHAFKTHLKNIASKIPVEQLESFISSYEPADDTFNSSTVEVFSVAIENSEISLNIIGPLFGLFCKTLTNCGPIVSQSLIELIDNVLKRTQADFSFHTVIKSVFDSVAALPNRIINQHERMVIPIFNRILSTAVLAKMPLSPKCSRALEKELETAVSDFTYKSNPHFGEEVFMEFMKMPESVSHILFPVVLKMIPNAKRLHRRITLLNIVTTILTGAKGLEIIPTKASDFNLCILEVLNDKNLPQTKEEEKRTMKDLVSIHKWLQLAEKKRTACMHVNTNDIRRKLHVIMAKYTDPLASYAKSITTTLQHIESRVHVKQRAYE